MARNGDGKRRKLLSESTVAFSQDTRFKRVQNRTRPLTSDRKNKKKIYKCKYLAPLAGFLLLAFAAEFICY